MTKAYAVCKYRSINGEVFDAVVVGMSGSVATIDVSLPAASRPVRITCVRDGEFYRIATYDERNAR